MCRMSVPCISDRPQWLLGSDGPAVFDVEYVQGCAVVVSAGEIDLCAAPVLDEVLAEAGKASDRIIIDLTDVTFLDSTGMTVMLDALNRNHHRQRGTLCLVGLSRAVYKALDVTHLTSQFPIYPSLRVAVEELA
jgi:anti-sigma B factor antagonist